MGMQRYSDVIDAPSASEGDDSLVGVNEWDAPENIPLGQVQSAVNVDFTSQDGVTRGGFVCLPELGTASFNAATGWTSRTSPVDRRWMAITFGSDRFVAVADQLSGTNDVMYSPDGVSWTSVSSGISGDWVGIAYGNGLYVAVGNTTGIRAGKVMTSPDGVTWTDRTVPDLDYYAVAYGDATFVVVARDGADQQVITSSDGVTWTRQTTPSSYSGYDWLGVAYGNSVFVAVGQSVMTSPDGVTWTARTPSSGASWSSVVYGNNRFVAVATAGGSQAAMTSPDGITWTTRTTITPSSSAAWQSVAYGNGVFVAVGSEGVAATAIMTSPDGITWTAASAPTNQEWYGVAYGNGTFAAVPFIGDGATLMTKSYYTTPNTTGVVLGSAMYSDPNDAGSQWVMLVGSDRVGFYAFGRTSRSVSYASGLTVSEQSTIVQANNQVFIFRGPDATPLRWDGNWANNFELATGTIQPSSQALYYQNRLWEIVGKDGYYASDVLDFTAFTEITNQFNLSTGDSNFLVTSYPFGNSTILLFKNRSILALSGVDGSLGDVVASEITRQVGAIGINAVVSVGPDVVYMSDRNINLITLTSTNNSLQHKTLPLSRNIQKIFNRVNWEYGYKVSMGFYDNKLFVALPLDNATTCNTVAVYNFVTENWFGEWNFDSSLGIAIQNFVIANYLGLQRLHAVTEDGRIFVVGEGPQDISGSTVAEISSSLTTRAYSFGNQLHAPRRMYVDLSTWRPEFSVTAYSNGVSEYTEEVTDQTYERSESWIFGDSAYSLTNSGDNYNRAGRKDYAGYCSDSIQPQSGFLPEAEQEIRFPILTRRNGRLSWLKVENTQGLIRVMSVGFEARAGARGNYIQAI